MRKIKQRMYLVVVSYSFYVNFNNPSTFCPFVYVAESNLVLSNLQTTQPSLSYRLNVINGRRVAA